MTDPAETITFDDGYRVEIHYDDYPHENPLKDWDGAPVLALHERAERHFGWTNDEDWADRLCTALDQIAERGHTTKLYGERGALEVVRRWLRTFHGVRVVLPVSGLDHSGHVAYLGDGSHWCDPGGWDSGWVGWLFATREQITEWGFDERTDEALEKSLRASFTEFAAWVSGEVFGYQVYDPDDDVVDSCWGFYGYDSYADQYEREFEIASGVLPAPGWRVKWRGEIRTVERVETRLNHWRIVYEGDDVHRHNVTTGDTITLVAHGHMREAFMSAIEHDRTERALQAADEQRRLAEDEAEIDDLRRAEGAS